MYAIVIRTVERGTATAFRTWKEICRQPYLDNPQLAEWQGEHTDVEAVAEGSSNAGEEGGKRRETHRECCS